MMDPSDCLQRAFAALLRGDEAERDRWCDLARNILNTRERMAHGQPPVVGAAICLPDRSKERLQ